MHPSGKPYSLRQKTAILKFVERYDEQHSRGGHSAAAAKFGVSRMSIFNWQREGVMPVKPSSRKAPEFSDKERARLLAAMKKMDKKLAKTLVLLASVQAQLASLMNLP